VQDRDLLPGICLLALDPSGALSQLGKAAVDEIEPLMQTGEVLAKKIEDIGFGYSAIIASN
jgi:hypothetical protein